jgi:uncharacterized OsmC-like protein
VERSWFEYLFLNISMQTLPIKSSAQQLEGRKKMKKVNVQEIQKPLRVQYKSLPEAARVTDHARTAGPDPSDPFHSKVEPMTGSEAWLPVGVHHALGGPHDAPTPGDILCAALAACQDSTIRMVANILRVELEFLEVEVTGDVDVRGTMAIDPNVPVGFQSMHCKVQLRAKEGTNPELLERLRMAAEHCCIVLQTLRSGVPIQTEFDMTEQNIQRMKELKESR